MYDLSDLFERVGVVARTCFIGAGAREHARKLQKEARELEDAARPDQIEEAADCLICLGAYCEDAGISADTLLAAARAKVEKCARRTWERQPDGTYQHVEPAPVLTEGECMIGRTHRQSADAPDSDERFRT